MVRNKLGKTDIEVSIIGLGTVKIGRNRKVKYPEPFDLPSDDEVKDLLHIAAELGINVIDTAPAYGLSEIRLGEMLFREKNYKREDWVIVSKAGEEFISDGGSYSEGISSYDFSPESIINSVYRSLTRLYTDYIDILLIHSDGVLETNINELSGVTSALEDLKHKGIIRAYGISTKTVTGGLAAAQSCDLVMVTYNQEDTSQLEVIKAAREHAKGILIKKAFASGHIIENVHTSLDSSPISDAYEFVFSQKGISSIITGTINPRHLKENVDAGIRAFLMKASRDKKR